MNLAAQRRRMIAMLSASGGGFAVALVGLVLYVALHARAGLALVAAGVALGVAAQIGFIVWTARAGRDAQV